MRTVTFRLKAGQLLKEEIEARAIKLNISAGVLLSAVGALKQVNLRMAGATPDKETIKPFVGSFEIVSGIGTISKGGCHMHISISDTEGNVFGGHLKDGCVVGVTAEIVIGVFDDVAYRRVLDKQTGFKELQVE